MNRGGRGPTMAERVAASKPKPPACPAKHCWVADALDFRGVKRPGLLVEWRRTDGEWFGRVVYVAEVRTGTWATVKEWLPASLLTMA